MKFLLSLMVLALLVAGGAWLWAGRAEGPRIEIRQPDKFVGQATPLDMVVESPGGQFARIEAAIEQKLEGQEIAISPSAPESGAQVIDLMEALKASLAKNTAKRAKAPVATGDAAESALKSVVIYLLIYAFSNLGAFAVVIAVSRKTGSGEISSFGGLMSYAPGLGALMTIFLASLTGVPPRLATAVKP